MYTLVLLLHSWLRWVALVAGVGAIATTVADRSATIRTGRSDMWGLALMITLDIQMLLGLLLYLVLSPFTTEAMRDFGAAMKNPALRFFAVEHVALMFAAVILVHVGRVLARKAPTAERETVAAVDLFRPRHRRHAARHPVARDAERPAALPSIIAASQCGSGCCCGPGSRKSRPSSGWAWPSSPSSSKCRFRTSALPSSARAPSSPPAWRFWVSACRCSSARSSSS